MQFLGIALIHLKSIANPRDCIDDLISRKKLNLHYQILPSCLFSKSYWNRKFTWSYRGCWVPNSHFLCVEKNKAKWLCFVLGTHKAKSISIMYHMEISGSNIVFTCVHQRLRKSKPLSGMRHIAWSGTSILIRLPKTAYMYPWALEEGVLEP